MKKLRPLIKRLREVWWRQRHRNFLIVFNWHQVTPEFDPLRHHQYTWTRLEQFQRELDDVEKAFQILPLHEALSRLNKGSLRGRCASLTFDDGDISMSDYVIPHLKQRGLPATIFINTAYLGVHRSYWFPILNYLSAATDRSNDAALTNELQEKALKLRGTSDPGFYHEVRSQIEQLASSVPDLASRLISAEWLSSLDPEQFSIGAHGHEHQRFAMMPAAWQQNDLRENVRILSQFRAFRPIFAVPFGRQGDWSEETIQIAHDQKLDVVLADGGINLVPDVCYRRIPSDAMRVRSLVAAIMNQ